MVFEGDGDEERPMAHRPLPPEDRLWRHPSELAGGAAPSAWSAPPRPPAQRRSSRTFLALAGAGFAGALVAVGVMWVTRPTRVVVEDADPARDRALQTAAFTTGVPSESLAERLAPTLVRVEASHDDVWSAATGVRLDDDGTIAVASPVVDRATAVMVTDQDGDRVPATVGASDPATGMAILTVSSRGGAVAPTRSVDAAPGQPVVVIGAASVAPGGATQQRVVTAAVSAVGLRTTVDPLVLHDALQLDRPVPTDATGGIVVDAEGRLVGIVLSGSGAEDLAVVVPAREAVAAAEGLRDDGEVRRAWLGVRAIDLAPSAAALLDVDGGAQLTAVQAGSPAARAGLREGDVITDVEGQRIGDASDLVVALRAWDPGERVEVEWHRGSSTDRTQVVLGG